MYKKTRYLEYYDSFFFVFIICYDLKNHRQIFIKSKYRAINTTTGFKNKIKKYIYIKKNILKLTLSKIIIIEF